MSTRLTRCPVCDVEINGIKKSDDYAQASVLEHAREKRDHALRRTPVEKSARMSLTV